MSFKLSECNSLSKQVSESAIDQFAIGCGNEQPERIDWEEEDLKGEALLLLLRDTPQRIT